MTDAYTIDLGRLFPVDIVVNVVGCVRPTYPCDSRFPSSSSFFGSGKLPPQEAVTHPYASTAFLAGLAGMACQLLLRQSLRLPSDVRCVVRISIPQSSGLE